MDLQANAIVVQDLTHQDNVNVVWDMNLETWLLWADTTVVWDLKQQANATIVWELNNSG